MILSFRQAHKKATTTTKKKLFNYAIPDSVYKAKQSRVW